MDEKSYWSQAGSHRISRRRALAALGALGAISLPALGVACSSSTKKSPTAPSSSTSSSKGSTSTEAPRQGGTLRMSISSDPPDWDVQAQLSGPMQAIANLMYSRLATYRSTVSPSDMTVVPQLAESWEQIDPEHYVLHLNPAAKWHNKPPVNGRPVVAADVQYSQKRSLALPTGQHELWEQLEPLQAPDDHTLNAQLKAPNASFLYYLAYNRGCQIVPHEVVEKDGDLKHTVIGSGPFMLDSYQVKVAVNLKRNPDYFEPSLPYLDAIHMPIIADASATESAFRSGQLDIISTTHQGVGNLKTSAPRAAFIKMPASVPNFFMFGDLRKSKFWQDDRVRRGFSLALDRHRYIQDVFQGDGDFQGPYPPTLEQWRYSAEEAAKYYTQDLTKAKQLLNAAGFPLPFKAQVGTTASLDPPNPLEILTPAVVQDLNQIGIQLNIVQWEYAEWLGHLEYGDAGLIVVSDGDHTDVDDAMWNLYMPDGARLWSRIADPRPESLIRKQRVTFDTAERKSVILDLQDLLSSIDIYPPLPTGYSYVVTQPKVKGYLPHVTIGNPGLFHTWLQE